MIVHGFIIVVSIIEQKQRQCTTSNKCFFQAYVSAVGTEIEWTGARPRVPRVSGRGAGGLVQVPVRLPALRVDDQRASYCS